LLRNFLCFDNFTLLNEHNLMSKFSFLKKILGENITKKIRPLGHGTKGLLAAARFGFPSHRMNLIGITGTKGKTTTTMYTGRLMNLNGIKTGYISTGSIYKGERGEQVAEIKELLEFKETVKKMNFEKNNKE
jgi:folylpolyglutamate synthase/dihydropteroate synthase